MKHFFPPTSDTRRLVRGRPSREADGIREASVLPGEAELIEAFLGAAIMELFDGLKKERKTNENVPGTFDRDQSGGRREGL